MNPKKKRPTNKDTGSRRQTDNTGGSAKKPTRKTAGSAARKAVAARKARSGGD